MPVAVDELLAVESIEDETSIRLAQQCLIDLGMLSGDADGLIGSKTIEAIKAFQTDYGLEITGKLDPATWVALQRALPAPIGEIQQRLIDLGYLTGSADGLWGSKSSAALKLFQSMHDLEPSGKIDAESVEPPEEAGRQLPGLEG